MNAPDNGSEFIRHVPCPNCGSSDANSEYTDGHTFCFACSHHTGASGATQSAPKKKAAGLIDGEAAPLVSRGISKETCEHFGYQKGTFKGRPVQIAPYYDADSNLVAQKIRFADKTFAWLGDSQAALPFGATKFPKSGKMIVVTEGEIDALAMSQVQGNKWPVVSIACGADRPTDDAGNELPMTKIRKYAAKHRDFFKNFEKVVVMFDSDPQGRASARAFAEVIGTNARIAELPLHDAADMLKEGKTAELISAMWNALPHRPSGIVELRSLRASVLEGIKWGLSWPWETLTKLTYGIRRGEVYCWGAGTGTGKTDVFTQIIEHLVRVHSLPVGVFSLEQSPKETAIRIAGKRAKRRYHVPDAGWTPEEFAATWDDLEATGRVFLYDSFGVNDWEVIEDRIRFLANAEGVKDFFIDHLTALAAWQDDERKALETIMSRIGGLVKELDITVYLISHLATPEGKPHEEGGRVMIRHLKGSRSIGFWCHYIFALERDQQADDLITRLTTMFRVLKDRYTGQATGQTFGIRYDQETGMLDEVSSEGDAHGFTDETKPNGDNENTDF
jgi:twinkle protein